MSRKSLMTMVLTAALCLNAAAQSQDGTLPDGTLPSEAGALQYLNPVIRASLPDPTVILAEDGRYYLFATEDIRNVPVYSSTDLVDWQPAGTAFTDETHPVSPVGMIWAPDINYFGGRYVLYYCKSGNGDAWARGIGASVSDRPEGPYRDCGQIILGSEIGVKNSIDQCYWEEDDGSKWLFWGSYNGIYAIELSEDGLSLKEGAEKVQVAGNFIEGTMIYRRGGYYYMIGSPGGYAGGAESRYRLVVARSESLLGPYVDRNGRPALENGFSELLNRSSVVAGPGHCSEVVEVGGRTWLLYHGYEVANPGAGRLVYLSEVFWDTEGWPYVAGGKPTVTWDRPSVSPSDFSYSDVDYIEYTGIPYCTADRESEDKAAPAPDPAPSFDTGYVAGPDTRVEVVCSYCPAAIASKGSEARAGKASYGLVSGRVVIFGGYPDAPFVGRIHSLKIYEGDELVRDYAPCLRHEDGMPMFHDAVTDTFIRPYSHAGLVCGNVQEQ